MIVIPEDLPVDVAPLAWMLGSWKGWGMMTAYAPEHASDTHAPTGQGDEEQSDQPVLENIDVRVVGNQMAVTTRIWAAVLNEGAQVDATWDAAVGIASMQADKLLWEETLYAAVEPAAGPLPPPGEYEPRSFTATAATTAGVATLWSGVAVGPRIQMRSDAVARDENALPIEHQGRMYGLVAGEMMWTQERTLSGREVAVEISGRLMRSAGDDGE